MEVNQVIETLEEKSSQKFKDNIIKLGIPAENSIGVPTTELRKLAKQIPRNKNFLFQLWDSGYHECKILTVLALKPKECTDEDIQKIMAGIVSWDLCDLFCKSILIKKDFDHYITAWISSEQLYYKRAAFTLIASTSTHAKLSIEEIQNYLNEIILYSDDDRLLIKKAVSWALRELGKTNEEAKELAIQAVEQLAKTDSKAQQWIAKDALKELTTLVRVAGRGRLISDKSKMGKENRIF